MTCSKGCQQRHRGKVPNMINKFLNGPILTKMSTSKSTYTLKEDLTASAASDDGSSGDDNDSVCDWASSLGEALQTRSLFSSTILTTPQAALQHDESQHGYSLKGESDRLELDLYGRMKLVNYIRKNVSGIRYIAESEFDACRGQSRYKGPAGR